MFVAVGKEIRWADLVYLKEAWEDGQKTKTTKGKDRDSRESQYSEDHAQGYRVSSASSFNASNTNSGRLSKLQSPRTFDN